LTTETKVREVLRHEACHVGVRDDGVGWRSMGQRSESA
jgi:hypothetical protein